MRALGLSPLELRSIIEKAFLPLQCRCEEGADASLNVWVESPGTGRMELLGRHIDTEHLHSSRDINELIARLRKQRNQGDLTGRQYAAG